MTKRSAITLFLCLLSCCTNASEILVAVANNFHRPLKVIAKTFSEETGNKVSISTGSSGQLYAQIKNGAPFDVFLSADSERPKKLVESGLATGAFTYAYGRLALWSPRPNHIEVGKQILTNPNTKYIALANPKVAPYGVASMEVIERLGVYPDVKDKLVMGKGLNATYQFVMTGNVDVGFLALSQLYSEDEPLSGEVWEIPESLYSPIRQDAVLIVRGSSNPAAVAFLNYLVSDNAKKQMAGFGYN